MFAGSRITQLKDWSIQVSQEEYARALKVVDVPRSSGPEAGLSSSQTREMRGLDGSLQWLVTNSRLDLAAPTSILQSHHANGKVKHLQDVNKLARTAYQTAKTTLTFYSHIDFDSLCIVTYHDAGQGSRPDGTSQGGYISIIANQSLLESKEELVTILDWRSFKLRRVSRSSLSAEVQAFSEAVDATEFTQLFLAEIKNSRGVNLRLADDYIRASCKSALVTDCKSLWDAVVKSQSSGLNLSEKRTSIEVLAGRERLTELNIPLKWVNSDRQLADGLTKVQASWKLQVFQLNPKVRLIYDPDFTAAKKMPKSREKIPKAKPSTEHTESIPLPPNIKPVHHRKSRIAVSQTPTKPQITNTHCDSLSLRRKALDKPIAALSKLVHQLAQSVWR